VRPSYVRSNYDNEAQPGQWRCFVGEAWIATCIQASSSQADDINYPTKTKTDHPWLYEISTTTLHL